MLKWFSTDEAGSVQEAPLSLQGGAEGAGPPLSEVAERLAQMEQLVTQLKEMIREKDAALHSKDEQLKAEKESCDAKLSKMRLQNKAKVTSLNSQLEELWKQQSVAEGKGSPVQFKRSGSGEVGEADTAGASRGKILLLKKKLEEMEQQLVQKTQELEVQRERGIEMDAMLVGRDKRLAEKEAYIVHLQMAVSGEHPVTTAQPISQDNKEHSVDGNDSLQELQMLVQNLTKKVGDGEERYSLLKEQSDSLKELLVNERAQFEKKENMYKQNIQTFKDIILEKDNRLTEVNQMHEQELFRLAAKSDASSDLEQLLKALKQKLHEKEEVLLGKAQVISVLQGEVDGRDQQIKDFQERLLRLQNERENMQSKLEAEKHIMRAQVRDLMEKHQEELRRVAEKHEMSGKVQQLEVGRRSSAQQATPTDAPDGPPSNKAMTQRLEELEAQVKIKADEASKSEAKFLKMKAWSKSRIRQLEDELKKAQVGSVDTNVSALRSRVHELEDEKEDMLYKLEQYNELKAKNDILEAKLVMYEEQQRKMQADLEQVTKRAASQASESGSMDDGQSQVLEWQDMVSMVAEAEAARDQAREEKNALVLRISHIEEEREALANRQQELEEELAQVGGLRPQKGKKPGDSAPRSLQEDFEFDGRHSFPDPRSISSVTTPMEGENMGGWWPEYSAPDTEGLRSVVEELELERNQLQEQILGLEERCQDLEDRLQLQARIETLQNESERLQAQVASLRSQQTRDNEKHQLLVTSLNEQLKGLSSTQECLESSLMEKEHTLAKTSEKLELIDNLRDSLREEEEQHKEVSEKLLQTEHKLTEVTKKCSTFEKQCTEMKADVAEVTQKLGLLKEKTQKQEATIESLQSDLDQTNDELDKLNTTHLEERAQLIQDLQNCEREIDNLKDIITDKDKEIYALSGNMAEYAEQIYELKQEIKHKQEDLVRVECTLAKAEQEAQIIRQSQSSDQHTLNAKMAELMEQLRAAERDLNEARKEKVAKVTEIKELTKQLKEDKMMIQDLRMEMQKLNMNQSSHLSECATQMSSLKEQILTATQKLQESEDIVSQLKETRSSNEKLKEQILDREETYEKELKSLKEERNKLLAEVTTYNSELQSLSSQLQIQLEFQEQVKENQETISSLEQRLQNAQERAEKELRTLNVELKARDECNENLEKELAVRTEIISKLEFHLESLRNENLTLQKALNENSEDLNNQKRQLFEVQENMDSIQNENIGLQSQVKTLINENHNLKHEIEIKVQSLSQISEERDSLLNKISGLEIQHEENRKIIEELIKDKEELNVRTTKLDVLEQNKKSLSETLLEKTNKCSHLNKLLKESEEAASCLQNQIEALNTQMDQFKCRMSEKEKTIGEKNAQIDAQQHQVMQLQETATLLQEHKATLESGLLEKNALLLDQMSQLTFIQNELTQQEDLVSKLQSKYDSLSGECTQLSQVLQERETALHEKTHECQVHMDELNKRNESVASLSSQLGDMNQLNVRLETENADLKKSLADLVANNNKLTDEMTRRQTDIVGLTNHIQVVGGQNQQLRAMYENKEKELVEIRQVVCEMDKKLATALEDNGNLASQISGLFEQNGYLQTKNDDIVKSMSELTAEKSSLLDKISGLEMQHAENHKVIEYLLKEKEELSLKSEELSKIIEQNQQCTAESLLGKNAECASLLKRLKKSEEAVKHLKEQAEISNSQFTNSIAEKEQLNAEQHKQIEGCQSQLAQLQETLSLLQEQSSALKAGIMEKDTVLQQQSKECIYLQGELNNHRELYTSLQAENVSLKGECSKFCELLKEKEGTLEQKILECRNSTVKLNKSSESVVSLTSELGVMNENIVKLKADNADLKNSLEGNIAESAKLREELALKRAEVKNLKCNIQALNEKNDQIKAELQISVTEISKRLEEVAALHSQLSNRDVQVASLTQQLATECSKTEQFQLELQQREESFRQQETFLNQLQVKSTEGEDQISQKMEAIAELQREAKNFQRILQEKDSELLKKDQEITLLNEKNIAELESSKTRMNSDMDVISKLQGELQILLEKSDFMTGLLAEKDALFKEEADKHLSIKTSAGKLEDTVLQLNSEVQKLSSEAEQLRATLNEKEQGILKIRNTSLEEMNSLNETLKAKDLECETLRQQMTDLNKSVSALTGNLSAQSAEITRLKAALEESRCIVVDQSKALQDLKRKADEAALFKNQLIENTELVSQLHGQIQELKEGSSRLSSAIEEKQSALTNLQDKFSSQVEDLQETKILLSQKNEEILNLNQVITERDGHIHTTENSIVTLKQETLLLQNEIQQLHLLNANISFQKDEALAAHKMNADSLTIEIERLKSQHLHVAAQVNSLTENLEQRELALHAINIQYTAQVEHTELVESEMQQLNKLCKKLQEDINLTKQELDKVSSERSLKEEEVNKLVLEKDELSKNYSNQVQRMQEQLQLQSQLQSSNMNEVMEKTKAETEQLQTQVSAKDDVITGLKSKVQRIEQTLQESEKKWLSVLDRETQAKNVLAEQLQKIENELLSKDSKVHALKRDLDYLNEKLAQATLAIKQGSEKLKEKELDALTNRSKLEEILSTVQAKEHQNFELRQALHDMKTEFKKLEESQDSQSMSDKVVAFEEEKVSLQTTIKRLQEDSESGACFLRQELDTLSRELEQKEAVCQENEKRSKDDCKKIILLSESVNHLQEELRIETAKFKEASVKHGTLLSEIQMRDEQISYMTIQFSQQKELLTGLSQQLKEKDASITQTVASASNERMRHEEQKNCLILQLEETKANMSLCQSQMENMDKESKALVKDNDYLKSEISKLTKDKEAIKKKLQAALVVRKELLKKIEEHENQNAQNVKNGLEMSAMQEKLEELMTQRNTVTQEHDAIVSNFSLQLKQKDSKINELVLLMSEKEQNIVPMEEDTSCLQDKLNEQETNLSCTLQKLDEQRHLIDHLQLIIKEKDAVFEQEKQEMMVKLEQLKNDLIMTDENVRVETSSQIRELENEFAKLKQEKAILQKKAHAALLARKETMKTSQETEKKYIEELGEIKGNYKALQEQNSQLMHELHTVQLSYNFKVQELESAIQSSTSLKEEMETLRRNNEDKERSLQDLRMFLTEQEAQTTKASSLLVEELDQLKYTFEETSSEMIRKDKLLVEVEARSKEFAEQIVDIRSELDSAVNEINEKNEEIARQKAYIQFAEQQTEQLQQDIIRLQSEHQNHLDILNSSIKELKSSVGAAEYNKSKMSDLQHEIERLEEERNLVRIELDSALAVASQKSDKLFALQNMLTVTQQQVSQEHSQWLDSISEIDQLKVQVEVLQKEKESCILQFEKSSHNVTLLESVIKQLESQNKELLLKIELTDKISNQVSSNCEASIQHCEPELSQVTCEQKDIDNSLVAFQTLLTEKEKLISALEQQLQRQIHLHEVEMEKMRIEVSELQQKPSEVKENKSVNQLTKKLQAALISRKELMKENWAIKQQMNEVSSQNEQIKTETMSLKSIVSELKRQRNDLESSISILSVEKQNLAADVDRILSDNHNLSAACESLKLTIENITQQKQAFSCQLESLKDSQTEELSEWKSKHADLKQEYESLLQAYENVSSEIDKMRQLLEGAKSERQQAILKAHKCESERDNLGKQVAELEKENEKIKEKIRKFAKLKQQKIEELEEENAKIRKDLISIDGQHKFTVDELTLRNNHLENEIRSLQESSDELRVKMCELQQDNQNLAQELKETSFSLEKWHMESKVTESNLQLKLNEALNLNNTFTSQIEAQKADLAAQIEIVELIQREKLNISEKLKQTENDHEVELNKRDQTIVELQHVIEGNRQETISLNEKVKILEDDKCLLQEELENVQETSDKVKNENEYLETVLLKNSEQIDELTEAVNVLQTQNKKLSTQFQEVKEEKAKVCQEKEEQHLKFVKEFEDKLKALQRGTEGSKNMKKELQELLKEKHQEINHLQHDCIKYQELFLNLERSLKHSQTEQERMEKELGEMAEKVSYLQKENKSLETELKSHKNALNEATKELARITSEKDGLQQELTKRQQQYEFKSVEMEKTMEKLAEQQQASLKEQRAELQTQINALQEKNEREAEVIVSLQKQLESKDLQIKTLHREAETNSSKLAVFRVDPNSSDAAKQWDSVFQRALHDKDSQLLEQGFVITRLLEDIRGKVRALNDLQIANKKLERTLSEHSVAAAAHQRQLFILGASNTELEQNVEILTKQSLEQSALIEKFKSDKSTLVKQLNEQTCLVSQLQSCHEHSDKVLADTESQLLTARSQCSKLLVDLERQETISLHLKSLLQNKDKEISSLLSSKDGQMSGYLEQVQANHRTQVAGYEDRLTALYAKQESVEKELRTLESKVRSLQARTDRSAQEKEQMTTNMNSLRNSFVSLQAEKEHLVSEMKQRRARGQEELAEGNLGVTKGIKQEIRTLLHQMDDLNSENAMLKAQLIRYREDLNQVLSLKDNQLKALLKKQQDSIKNLENQKRTVEMQHHDALLEVEKEGEEIKALKDQNSKLQSQVQELEDRIFALHKERLETNLSKVITDLQQVVAAKAAECNELQQKWFAQKVTTDDLSKSVKEMMKESETKLAGAEEKYNKELVVLEREVDLMRNERETAEQRVADLARDLMQTEQQLSEATSHIKNLKSQNESLGKAMAALQNDRDQLIDDFKILHSRYDEELRETTASRNKFERQLNDATSEISALTTERNVLVQKLLALESTDSHSQLSGLVNDLSRAISEKEAELKHVTLENSSFSRQVTAFSKAMASLQTDRDRLMEELRKAKREFECRQQQLSADTLASIKAEESNSLSVSVDALQTERDGLFKEVVNLRSQNTELVELQQKYDDQQRELQQAQVYKLQCEKEIGQYKSELPELRSEKSRLETECHALKQASKESVALVGKDVSSEQMVQIQAERSRLQTHLQRCLVEIQQRDLDFQQLNTRLQQAMEEKAAVSAQLRAVSQTLRDTQLSFNDLHNRCYLLENQHQIHHAPTEQDSVRVEVAPGAPQEKSSAVGDLDNLDVRELRSRLAEAELQLDSAQQNVSQLNNRLENERARREAAEEVLVLAEERNKSTEPSPSRSSQRDFTIQLETDEEWEALILDPNQHLLMRKMKTGVHSCRRWLRGRSMYCSKLLTSRAKSRYLFLTYLLALHVLVFMCLSGTL